MDLLELGLIVAPVVVVDSGSHGVQGVYGVVDADLVVVDVLVEVIELDVPVDEGDGPALGRDPGPSG